MLYNIHFSCISHIGNCRSMNQDNFICNNRYIKSENDYMDFPLTGNVMNKSPVMFGVFDGMGGEEYGEIASLIAAKMASQKAIGKNALSELSTYCFEVNEAICKYAQENSITSMGTTAAILVFADKEIVLCNIGDSKIFRFSKTGLEQISFDHIAVCSYGTKPPLSQNLGIPTTELLIDPYLAFGKYTNGDIYLICSDGLTDMVSITDIERILQRSPSLAAATNELLKRALRNGGKDNITFILCEVEQVQNSIIKFFKKG